KNRILWCSLCQFGTTMGVLPETELHVTIPWSLILKLLTYGSENTILLCLAINRIQSLAGTSGKIVLL
ncbi:hypothetical protein, partial [Vibrio viridaestus]|uniref:hypothetical protein n=1 Tax=Vibrio viridaestus TaxID=2487322 RepID=UPI001AA07EDD